MKFRIFRYIQQAGLKRHMSAGFALLTATICGLGIAAYSTINTLNEDLKSTISDLEMTSERESSLLQKTGGLESAVEQINAISDVQEREEIGVFLDSLNGVIPDSLGDSLRSHLETKIASLEDRDVIAVKGVEYNTLEYEIEIIADLLQNVLKNNQQNFMSNEFTHLRTRLLSENEKHFGQISELFGTTVDGNSKLYNANADALELLKSINELENAQDSDEANIIFARIDTLTNNLKAMRDDMAEEFPAKLSAILEESFSAVGQLSENRESPSAAKKARGVALTSLEALRSEMSTYVDDKIFDNTLALDDLVFAIGDSNEATLGEIDKLKDIIGQGAALLAQNQSYGDELKSKGKDVSKLLNEATGLSVNPETLSSIMFQLKNGMDELGYIMEDLIKSAKSHSELVKADTNANDFKSCIETIETNMEKTKQYEASLSSALSEYRDQVALLVSSASAVNESILDDKRTSENEIARIGEASSNRINEGISRADSSRKKLIVAMSTAILIGVVMAALLPITIARAASKTTTQMTTSIGDFVRASQGISDHSQRIENSSNSQAAKTQELTASIEMVSSEIKKLRNEMMDASHIISDAREKSDGANSLMQEISSAMKNVQDASANAMKVTGDIDTIAFQTNILALNAAVEAARAGEAGTGFAVVAEEVRALSARSAKASKDTSSILGEIAGSISDRTAMIESLATDFSSLNGQVSDAVSSLEKLQSAAEHQENCLTNVCSELETFTEMIHESRDSAQEFSALGGRLSTETETLRGQILDLKQTVEGKKS